MGSSSNDLQQHEGEERRPGGAEESDKTILWEELEQAHPSSSP